MAEAEAQTGGAATATEDSTEFQKLLQADLKVSSDTEKQTVDAAVATLAEQALANVSVVSGDVIRTIESVIAELDRKLTSQVNRVIHHEDFQKLESAWRGLHHLVNNTETDELLKIRVLPVGKKELGKSLAKFKGVAWDQSPIFRKIYTAEYSQFGGEPFGALVGDFEFDHSPQDVEMLGEISKVAAAAHCPFVAAAGAGLVKMDSWQDLPNPRDLAKVFATPDYAAWKSLRESEDSRYLALTLPRFLARLPYGARTVPVEGFAFEEETDGTDHDKYCWANSAYAMATNITGSFKRYGWCSMIRGVESGGVVDSLPVHTFPTDDGGVDMKCPTEVAIDDRREKELSDLGFLPLLHKKNHDYAAFIGAQSLQKPKQYEGQGAADANASANLSARLPYLFACCRFAHYLKAIVRDKVGSFKERDAMETWLNDWIKNYVHSAPHLADQEALAMKPLAAARVDVQEVEGNPGYYTSQFFLRPHYQLEGLEVSLRLVSKLPTAGG